MGCFSSKEKRRHSIQQEDLEFLKTHTNFEEDTIKQWHDTFMRECPDGRLDKEKFMELYKAIYPRGQAETFCEHVFRVFDTDKSGEIDFREFMSSLSISATGTPEQRLEWSFNIYDMDENGTIELNEMAKIIKAVYSMVANVEMELSDNLARSKAILVFKRFGVSPDKSLTKEQFISGCLADPEMSNLLAPKICYGPEEESSQSRPQKAYV